MLFKLIYRTKIEIEAHDSQLENRNLDWTKLAEISRELRTKSPDQFIEERLNQTCEKLIKKVFASYGNL